MADETKTGPTPEQVRDEVKRIHREGFTVEERLALDLYNRKQFQKMDLAMQEARRLIEEVAEASWRPGGRDFGKRGAF